VLEEEVFGPRGRELAAGEPILHHSTLAHLLLANGPTGRGLPEVLPRLAALALDPAPEVTSDVMPEALASTLERPDVFARQRTRGHIEFEGSVTV
jgi:hypothetical protein